MPDYGLDPTSLQTTMTVTDVVTSVPAVMFAGSCVINGVIVGQVLSGAILLTEHDPAATPTLNDFQFFTGDFFVLRQPERVRMIRNGTSACVKFQHYQ